MSSKDIFMVYCNLMVLFVITVRYIIQMKSIMYNHLLLIKYYILYKYSTCIIKFNSFMYITSYSWLLKHVTLYQKICVFHLFSLMVLYVLNHPLLFMISHYMNHISSSSSEIDYVFHLCSKFFFDFFDNFHPAYCV